MSLVKMDVKNSTTYCIPLFPTLPHKPRSFIRLKLTDDEEFFATFLHYCLGILSVHVKSHYQFTVFPYSYENLAVH